MPMYTSPPLSPVRPAFPSSFNSPSRSNSFSHSAYADRKPTRRPKHDDDDDDDDKVKSYVKGSLIFLGSVAAATYCAHKYWPKGFVYGDKDDWEHRVHHENLYGKRTWPAEDNRSSFRSSHAGDDSVREYYPRHPRGEERRVHFHEGGRPGYLSRGDLYSDSAEWSSGSSSSARRTSGYITRGDTRSDRTEWIRGGNDSSGGSYSSSARRSFAREPASPAVAESRRGSYYSPAPARYRRGSLSDPRYDLEEPPAPPPPRTYLYQEEVYLEPAYARRERARSRRASVDGSAVRPRIVEESYYR
ncbi:hypothetical protein B0T24DRAFT_195761 [Lasiosphaeria ovina]|uniref:Uncharacterized protein n=1 Tax=Lasiosphaeria ovina TaxID=92902 RepID=A0AAE0TUY3_9PEZI|nr:hypothetical protein B0T24DRAFT_195761 [Lasiosphaeria ovina]